MTDGQISRGRWIVLNTFLVVFPSPLPQNPLHSSSLPMPWGGHTGSMQTSASYPCGHSTTLGRWRASFESALLMSITCWLTLGEELIIYVWPRAFSCRAANELDAIQLPCSPQWKKVGRSSKQQFSSCFLLKRVRLAGRKLVEAVWHRIFTLDLFLSSVALPLPIPPWSLEWGHCLH